jgi:hypothetical protein
MTYRSVVENSIDSRPLITLKEMVSNEEQRTYIAGIP